MNIDEFLEIRQPLYNSFLLYKAFNKEFKENKIYKIDNNHNNFLLTNLTEIEPNYDYPIVEIGKEFWFEAAHNLPNYKGPCNNIHGHSFNLKIYIKNRIESKTKMVMDYKILKEIVQKYILDSIDHKNLNLFEDEILNESLYPTSEMLLLFLWYRLEIDAKLKGLSKIILKETNTSEAIITQKDILGCGLYLKNVYLERLQNVGF